MSSKIFDIKGIGTATICKKRGTRRINLRVNGNKIKITQPSWLPYASGIAFIQNNKSWITEQQGKQASAILKNGMNIGKHHRLKFVYAATARSRINNGYIIVYTPNTDWTDQVTQQTAKKAIRRALKKESTEILPDRLYALSKKYSLHFEDIKFKAMKSRWGSCNNTHIITLNIYLIMLPWELIDYVLLHELTHTKHLNHSKDFWQTLETYMPDYKIRRKQLKNMQHLIAPIQ